MASLRVRELDSASVPPIDRKAKEWEEIEEEDDNMLVKLQWEPWRQVFFDELECQIPSIRRLVTHHLSLSRSLNRFVELVIWMNAPRRISKFKYPLLTLELQMSAINLFEEGLQQAPCMKD